MGVTTAQRIFTICISAAVLLQIAQASALHVGNLGIFGGHIVSIEEVPYMTELIRKDTNGDLYTLCGGSIVHERFILSAAHCAEKVSGNLYATVGIDHLNPISMENLIEVEKICCHEGFKPRVYFVNDICLFKLKKSIAIGPKASLVKLADEDVQIKQGDLVTACGWGTTGSSTDNVRDLRQVTIPIVNRKLCRRYYGNLPNVFCAGINRYGDCKGDSGTPIMYNGTQIGVVSGGKNDRDGCNVEYIGGINVKVSSYLQWINDTIKENL